jgi:hypothetical protein
VPKPTSARAAPARPFSDIAVFEVETGAAAPGRKIREEQRQAGGLAIDESKQRLEPQLVTISPAKPAIDRASTALCYSCASARGRNAKRRGERMQADFDGELRLFLEELCCELCRLRHVREGRITAEDVKTVREVPLSRPNAFADILVTLRERPAILSRSNMDCRWKKPCAASAGNMR